MTFKHKLSKRLAMIYNPVLLLPLAATLGCTSGGDPLGVAAVNKAFVVSPGTIALSPNQSFPVRAVKITASGDSIDTGVTWSASGGTIRDTAMGSRRYGVFRAGSAFGTYKIIAADAAGSADTARVIIASTSGMTSLSVYPGAVLLQPGSVQQFTAYGHLLAGDSVAVAATFNATGGSVSSTGAFVAGRIPGNYSVIAHVDQFDDSAQVSVPNAGASAVVAALPAGPRVYLNTFEVTPTGSTIAVHAGDNLQAALGLATCGDLVLLDPATTFVGNFSLPSKSCTGWITIKTKTTLPAAGQRMTLAQAGSLAKLVAPNTTAALIATGGAHHYRIIGIEVTVAASQTLNYGAVLLGRGDEASVSDLPHDIVLDRVYIHGHPTLNLSRCVALNGASLAVIDSHLSECHGKGLDTQAIAGWNGTGPFKIVNNYLEGAGQNIMFGGADPRISGLVPSDIEIRHNHMFKPLAWMPGRLWTVKNTLELKNAQRVLIEGNLMENCWLDGQVGFAMVMFSVNQSGGAPWSTVQDVTVRSNILRNVAAGMNISAGQPAATPAARFLIVNNLLDRFGSPTLGGNGTTFQELHGLADLTIDHNTAVYAADAPKHSALFMDYDVGHRLVFRNNVLEKSILTSGNAGTAALDLRYAEWNVERNVLAGGVAKTHPPGNFFPASPAEIGYQGLPTGVYALTSRSFYHNLATDGTDPGVDWAALQAAQANVVVP